MDIWIINQALLVPGCIGLSRDFRNRECLAPEVTLIGPIVECGRVVGVEIDQRSDTDVGTGIYKQRNGETIAITAVDHPVRSR